jgi:hypothetical protein
MRLPKGYLPWNHSSDAEPLVGSYISYIESRAWRMNKIWLNKIAIDDAIHRKNQQAKENVIKIVKAIDKQRKRYYIPKEQKYIGVQGMNDIFGSL